MMIDKIEETRETLKLKDVFCKSRHNEKIDLIEIRHKYGKEIIDLRDNVSTKRHNERLEIIGTHRTQKVNAVNNKVNAESIINEM